MQAASQKVHEVVEIDADVASVWRAWTDPDWLAGWMVDRTVGELRAGGAVEWRWDSLGVALELEVVELEPPARLVLRGGPRGRAPQTQSVSLAEVDGRTRVQLTHTGFAPGPGGDGERAGTAAGWRVMLRVLAHYLARGAGRRRESAAILAPVPASIAALGRLLHDANGRAGWLVDHGDSPALAAEGDEYALDIAPGVRASGRVLALAPPFELALSWDEVDGVLILRAIQLAAGADRPVLAGAHAWSWSPERAAWRAARAALEGAVARLARAAGGGSGALA